MKFPFSTLRLSGHRPRILHQIGRCAVAHVTSAHAPPFYAVRFGPYHAEAATLADLPQAFATVGGKAAMARRAEQHLLAAADAISQLGLTPACLRLFADAHGLDVARTYSRRDVRRAITDLRLPKMGMYLALLKVLTPTNPLNHD